MKYPNPYLLAIGIALCSASTPLLAADSLATLSWLSGCWAGDGQELGSGEQWMPLAGGSLVGVGRTVKGGKTVATELMKIEADTQGNLVFTAVPSGQPETSFKQLRMDASEVVFQNLENAFPHRVAYRRIDNDRVQARIEGNNSKGEPRVIEFPLTRRSCDAPLAANRR